MSEFPYELAKELKDAGFPQPNMKLGMQGTVLFGKEGVAYSPTLSELIEAVALPLSYFSLEQHSNDWRCGFLSESVRKQLNIQQHYNGATPKEAVARLWLAVHSKKHGRDL